MTNQVTHSLIPIPYRIIHKVGVCPFNGTISVSKDPLFADVLNTLAGQLVSCGIVLNTSTVKPRLLLEQEQLVGTDAYRIVITPDSVILTASGNEGMFHATQTLRQLVLSGNGSLPCLEIEDRSSYAWRGCMLDCSRHFHTVTFIKKLLDLMGLHHLNIFHWHLTDDQGWRFPVPEYPELTEVGAWRTDSRQSWQGKKGGFYSREDIDEIVNYARDRFITVVPEIDLPGHVSALLTAFPGFGCTGGPYKVEDRFGIFDDVLCAGNPELEPFLDTLFDTLADCFPGPWVHIGGDEVPTTKWESCPKCREVSIRKGLSSPAELQQVFTRMLSGHLIRRGKTPVGWDEILDSPKALSHDTVVMSWRGKEGGVRAAADNFRVIMTPLDSGCYLNFRHLDDPDEPGHLGVSTIDQCANLYIIPPGVPQEQRKLFLGGQGNLWCEVIESGKLAEYMLFPRLCLLAEAFWSNDVVRKNNPVHDRIEGLNIRLDRLGVCSHR